MKAQAPCQDKTYVVHTVLDGGRDVETIYTRELCRHEDVRARKSTFFQSNAGFCFIPIVLRCVYAVGLMSPEAAAGGKGLLADMIVSVVESLINLTLVDRCLNIA
jgi:hypothetical protein